MKPDHESSDLSVDEALEALGAALAAVESAHDDRVCDLEGALDDARFDLSESRGVEEWVGRVVCEADGKVLDGLGPAAILEWLLSTLRAERGLHRHHNLVA